MTATAAVSRARRGARAEPTALTLAPVGTGRVESLQGQLSSVRGLLAISLVMMERRQERDVLHLAATAVPSLVRCQTVGIHLDGSGWEPSVTSDGDALARADLALAGCPPGGGRLDLPGHGWAWALPLRSLEEFIGHLVVAGTAEPTPAEQVLLRSLAQQTGVAVANARLHASKEARTPRSPRR